MLYKMLALTALLVQDTNAAGAANSLDPRALWFRWAVPLGGGYVDGKSTVEGEYDNYKNADGQNVRKCGVDLAPNSITKCYYTDCFRSLHDFPGAPPSRRRAAGSENHYAQAYGPCGNVEDRTLVYGDNGMRSNNDAPATARRRMANAPHLSIQCKRNTCKVPPGIKQFRYWKGGEASYAGLGANATYNGDCPGGNDATPEESWIWYGTVQSPGRNCIYDASNPAFGVGNAAECECKTLVCRVSTEKEAGELSGRLGQWDAQTAAQQSDECNFIVRIEDFWSAPSVSKKMMWWIFSISASLALMLTAFYYVTYGAELVKGHGDHGGEGHGHGGDAAAPAHGHGHGN